MSNPSTSPTPLTPEPWNERRDRWFATLISALVHLLMLLILMFSNPPVVSSPEGSSGGGRVKVDFVGEAPPSPETRQVQPQPKPSVTPRSQPKPTTHRRSPDRKPVREARYIEPPSEPEQEENQTPAETQAPATPPPAAAPSESVPRRTQTWTGRPPGWVEKTTSDDDGRSAGQGSRSGGNRVDRSNGEPSMEIGGYQIIYDLLSETRLRARMDEGMKELLIPLPGTTYVMVCPAEVALRRGSSKCRMLPADSPELQAMGDARQFVIVMYVYRYGELLWRGPGPYR